MSPAEPQVGQTVTVRFPVSYALPGGFSCGYDQRCEFVGGAPYLSGDTPPVFHDGEVVVHRRVARAGVVTVQMRVSASTEQKCHVPDEQGGCRSYFSYVKIDRWSQPFEVRLVEGAPPRDGCDGDCDGDTEVAVHEIVTLVDITLGNADVLACEDGIPADAEVNIALIVRAVNNALNGCAG